METIIQRSRPLPENQAYGEIFLAGGCFWGLQKYFDGFHGVLDTDVGYANGHSPNPTYAQVCAHGSGHAETVRVVYDPGQVSLKFLLEWFFRAMDPTSVNRQGPDVGDQYRSGIYYVKKGDQPIIQAALEGLSQAYDRPIAVVCEALSCYYLADNHHQDYLKKNPAGYCHISSAQCAAAHQARESKE